MIEISNKYIFKKIDANNITKFSILEDPFGKQHNLPLILNSDTVELLYVKKIDDKDIFTQLKCEQTNYLLNETCSLPIIKAKEDPSTNRFEITVRDNVGRDFRFYIPDKIYEKVKLIGKLNCKIISILGDRIIFRHAEILKHDYKENIVYEFEVIDFCCFERDQKINYNVNLKGLHDDTINIKATEWQYKNKVKFSKLYAKAVRKENDSIFFKQDYSQLSHPYFKSGIEYEFVFLKEETERDKFAALEGPDGCKYWSFLPFHLENEKLKSGDIIKYVYRELIEESGNLRLKSFIQFEDIIKNYRALKRLTFDSIFNDSSENELVIKFKSDYTNFQNLWIISFCEILRQKITETINSFDYDTALIFIDVLVQTEKWILESGFLNTFSEFRKIETEKTAKNEIETFNKIAKALEILLDNKQVQFIDTFVSTVKEKKCSDLEDQIKLTVQIFRQPQNDLENNVEKIISLFYNIGIKYNDFYKTKGYSFDSVVTLLEKYKINLEKKLLAKVFISSKERNKFYNDNIDLEILLQLNLLLANIFRESGHTERLHLAIAKIFKLYSFFVSDHQEQQLFLTFSMNILQSPIANFKEKNGIYLIWEHIYELHLFIKKNGNILNIINPLTQFDLLNISLKNKSVLIANIIEKNEIGYILNFEGDRLIMPYYTTNRLYTTNEKVEVIVTRIDQKFSTVFVNENRKLIGENLIQSFEEIKVGDVVRGKIFEIESKHVKINLGRIDAIMFINDISMQFVSHPSAIFKLGQIIDSKIIEIEEKESYKVCRVSRKELLLENFKTNKNVKGQKFSATITKVDDYQGLLVELENGYSSSIELRHISWNPIFKLSEVFDIGDKINVKIHSFFPDGNFKVSALITDHNPLKNYEKLSKTVYDAKIFEIYDLNYWFSKYNIVLEDIDNTGIFHCPKCYENSDFKIKKNIANFSKTKTLKIDTNNGKWSCTYCKWSGEDSIMFWISELNCTAALKLSKFDTFYRNNLLKDLSHGDFCKVKISSISKLNSFVFVDIIENSILHKPRIIQNAEYNNKILDEIAANYEHYSFLTNEYQERINYLNFSRYYYGAAHNFKSYYLKAYVDFTNIVYSLESKDLDGNILDPMVETVSELISQIEQEELSVEIFPIIETIIKILKILRLYKTQSKDELFFLLKTATENQNDQNSIKELAKTVLSLNLLSDEDTNILKDILNKKITNLLRNILTLFEDVEIDQDEIDKQNLIYKLMSKGEKSDSEFKASLDVPVLSKIQKKEIMKLRFKLLELKHVGNVDSIIEIEKQIKTLSKVEVNSTTIRKDINISAIKTLAAFANTNGGYLVIGIDEDENDNPMISGLTPDYTKHKSMDGLRLKFDQLVEIYLGDSFNQYIESFDLVSINGKDLVLIKISASYTEPVFLKKTEGDEHFFIRRQASTVSLSAHEQYKYLQTRQKNNIFLEAI